VGRNVGPAGFGLADRRQSLGETAAVRCLCNALGRAGVENANPLIASGDRAAARSAQVLENAGVALATRSIHGVWGNRWVSKWVRIGPACRNTSAWPRPERFGRMGLTLAPSQISRRRGRQFPTWETATGGGAVRQTLPASPRNCCVLPSTAAKFPRIFPALGASWVYSDACGADRSACAGNGNSGSGRRLRRRIRPPTPSGQQGPSQSCRRK
jgi:hypothetical protein